MHCPALLPGPMAVKARTTVMVFAKMVGRATVNTIPKVVCQRRLVTVEGQPVKSKEQEEEAEGQ